MTKFERLQSMSLDEFAELMINVGAKRRPSIRVAVRSEYLKSQLLDEIKNS